MNRINRSPLTALLFSITLILLMAQGGGLLPAASAQEDAETRQGILALQRASKARAAIVKKVSPAVVHISVEKVTRENGQENQVPDLFDEEFFRRFFGPRMPNPREFRQRGLGSGSIIDRQGHILTNNHVVKDADRIVVKLKDGREFEAKLIGADPPTDLAVVKIDATDLPLVQLGNSDALEVGETVIAIGNPFGLEQTVTQGIVSAKKRSQVGLTDYEDFIQTDASINPGNSGGPLINLNGEVVGVNTAIFSRTGGSMGIGFSIPINMAKQVMKALIDDGKFIRGFLGVVIQDVTKELADALGVKVREGVLIANVGTDTPAGKAGIRQQDIITHFNGKEVKNTNALRNAVAATKPGTRIQVRLLREGKPMRLSVAVGEQPDNMRAAIEGEAGPGGEMPETGGTPEESLGLQVRTLTASLGRQLGYANRRGVVVSQVEPNSPAAEKGLRRGVLIERVNSQPVNNVQQFRTEIAKVKKGQSILMLVRFRQSARFVVIKKP